MRRAPVIAGALGAGALGAAAAALATRHRPLPPADRWHAVTVALPPERVAAALAPLTAPLARLGDDAEVEQRPAPGDRGTELRVRAREGAGDGFAARARVALRETRSLLETGEVPQPDEPGTTRRTVTSLPLELALRHAREGGRL